MDKQLILSLIAAIFIGGISGYLGSLLLSKRMALVAGPLGHLSLPGIAIAILLGFNVALGAFPFVFLGVVLIWLLEIKTKLPMEALTAVVFASGVAIAFLFLPIEQAESALVGDITQINYFDTVLSSLIAIVLFLIIQFIYPKMVLINISEDLARSEGISVKKYNFLYLVLIAITVAMGVQMVGGLLTAALVAIPPASARNFSRNLTEYRNISLLIGSVSSCIGVLFFKLTAFPAGPLIILTSTFIFLASLFCKKC
ncbi:metal ABC transporter permease [Legionella spiritensis]|uniref:metal ABC transporter permease n=1 Tax=Legionella spiritensis TaxID=452 RepID=UPI000F6F2690|nr:iron chelate uptake ABC transporter family permease subunit [Legionella spiritensis]VEG92121.1 ABC transporter permease [Legionella spiritensis]